MNATLAAFDNTTGVLNETAMELNGTTLTTPSGRSGGIVMAFPWDNPENIVKQIVSDDVGYGMQCVVFPIITLFGMTGNILSLIVLTRKQIRKSTTSIVLIALAASDLCFLITNMIRKSRCIIDEIDEMTGALWNAVSFRYVFYLRLVFSRISTLLVVVICIERFLAVAMPLKVKTIVTRTRMLLVIIGCYVFTFVGIGAIPFQYTWKYLRSNPVIWPSQFANENVDGLKIYNEYFLPIVFRYIPVIVVMLLTLAIITLLNRSQQFKKTSAKGSNRNDEQSKITRMLMTVALIYLVCLIPGDAVLIASDIHEKFRYFGNYHNLFLIVSDVSLFFELINSSVNFIIYMVLNKNFYAVYASLFCGRCIRALEGRRQRYRDSESKGDTSSKGTLSGTKDTKADSSISKNDDSAGSKVHGHTNQSYEIEKY